MGANSYEVRGSELYPSDSEDFDDDFWPVFEIRGSEIYPTVYNNRDSYGLPAFEIRDGYAWPTHWNDHDEEGFSLEDDESTTDELGDLTFKDLAAGAAVAAALFAGAKGYQHVKQHREQSRDREAGSPQEPAMLPAPPGWYPTEAGLLYWNGVTWTPPAQPRSPMTPRKNSTLIAISWILTVLSAGYLLPWAVAASRAASNTTKVGLVSFFLGWTVIGWVVALVMACTGTPKVGYA